MIFYGKQSIDEEDIKNVVDCLRSDFLTTGPKVKEFEKKFAEKVGAKYAVAVSNGTAALHLACLAAKLGDGELITSPITFLASANCALYCNGKPIFVDVTKQGLIDPDKIEEKINNKSKVIIPVHYSGLTCNMKKIKEIADRNGLIVIEDACHALGATYNNTKVGDCKYSDMAVFSFHPVKHITTGEGGMITTNSETYYKKLLKLRNHGIEKEKLVNETDGPWYYEMQNLGYNYRITDIQCALGISQLEKLDKFVKKRREIAKKYDASLKVEIIKEKEGQFNSYHLYVIKLNNKEERLHIFNYLKDNNIICQVHYIPVYFHPYYQKLGYKKGLCPQAEEFYEKILSIPIYPNLKEEEQKKIITLINNFESIDKNNLKQVN